MGSGKKGLMETGFGEQQNQKEPAMLTFIPKWAILLYTSYMEEGSSFEEVRDAIMREELLQTLPQATSTHVCKRQKPNFW